MSFESARRVLEQFSREIGNPPIGEVQAEAVAAFLRGRGALSATWALKYKILSGFYGFAISRGHAQRSPLPANMPKLPPQRSPFVYSVDELRRLLEATSVVHINNTPLQAPMCRMLLIPLYGSGLRVGEALHLTLPDIDLIEKIVTVSHTKILQDTDGADRSKAGAGAGCVHAAPARPSLAVGR
jgi:integrase/recombinase XerD